MRNLRTGALLLLAVGLGACTTVGPRLGPQPPPAATGFSHRDFDAFLGRHVEGGRVDYRAAAEERADLDRYLAALAAVSPDSHPERFGSEAERLAYWINAYNASVIALVLKSYPITSVRDVRPPTALFFLPRLSGFFVFRRVTLGGRNLDLLTLENRIVRKRFGEPRIHFALNCASIGCPRLPSRAFTAAGLDAELDAEARRFFAEARNLHLDREARVVRLSPILDWFESDFTDWLERERPERPATLVEYASLHLPRERAEALRGCRECRVEFARYDWGLNDRAPPRMEASRRGP